MRSTVKKWMENGYGFLNNPDGSNKDIFLHARDVKNVSGRIALNPGDEVEFEMINADRGLKAVNARVI